MIDNFFNFEQFFIILFKYYFIFLIYLVSGTAGDERRMAEPHDNAVVEAFFIFF